VNIYVGNLNYETTEEQMRGLFEQFGQVESVSIITDRATGRPRGFGFVQMPDDAEAQKAIDELNGTDFDGRTLTVNQARAKSAEPGDGGRRYRSGS
jgi:RNA recognition motif-containing protein